MKVKQNIGILNALIRITCGLTFLSWSTAKLVKRPWNRNSYMLVAFLSAMKVAEGIVRFCPLTALYEERQDIMDNFSNDNNNKNEGATEDQMIPHNPT